MNYTNKIDVLLGLQWGDEGKGKIIDVLTPDYDIIARFQGGPNAGHTLEFNGQKHVLHLIPSGIFHTGKINLLGNGMVIDPAAFYEEIKMLMEFISQEELRKRIVISNGANVIIPTHRLLDAAYEAAKGNEKIGSTLKGISPTYTDKISRDGIRIGDMSTDKGINKYYRLKEKHLQLLASLAYEIDENKLAEEEEKFNVGILTIQAMQKVNGAYWLDKQLKDGKTVLAEGAQGTLLDIEHGNYPFVTSSNTICGGVCTGLGIAPNRIGKVYGLFKAYCTRVGMGPFPTELGGKKSDEWCATKKVADEDVLYPDANINDADPFIQGIALRRKGYEFGATTGRLRRTGWLDLPALKYACMINGVTDLIISKTDILSGIEKIEICVNHSSTGNEEHEQQVVLGLAESDPLYRSFLSWENISDSKTYSELPGTCKKYMNFIEAITHTPISIISVGPDRDQIIKR